ncbi:MFS transporter [Eikenella sp. S3360]|uniref:MFS transporter n=1 Tax=Eikenella glucosivorans TaxID=2766967 RepID=A0ABS0NBX4_9NEIS|nr:MFS transporter [Eikenella glucosivorans]MBH5329757.1 MFS transporter [Eikenella glucosivorans]
MNSGFKFATSRRFAPLFGTQFLGALNDNLFKIALATMISFYGLGQNGLIEPAQMINVSALLFVLPFFLFSALSGQLCNKFDRGRMAVVVKVAEVLIMMLATVGFLTQSLWLLLFSIFLMGLQSTLFGPLKYAVLPDYLDSNELIVGNSLIESGTFLAILFGQILGTILAGIGGVTVSVFLLLIAVGGLVASMFMPRVAPKTPDAEIDWYIVRNSKTILKQAFADKNIYAAIIGISWFWFIGAVYTTQLPTFTKLHLGGNDNVFNLMLTLFSIGIGSGSVVCAKLSHRRLNLGWVAVGTVGMAVFGLLLVALTHGARYHEYGGIGSFLLRGDAYAVMLCIVLLGFCGGFFSVPLYTWLQTASSEEFRAHAIAANNIVNGFFMVAAALLSAILLWLFDSINLLYLVVALGNIVVLVYLLKIAPPIGEGVKKWFGKEE